MDRNPREYHASFCVNPNASPARHLFRLHKKESLFSGSSPLFRLVEPEFLTTRRAPHASDSYPGPIVSWSYLHPKKTFPAGATGHAASTSKPWLRRNRAGFVRCSTWYDSWQQRLFVSIWWLVQAFTVLRGGFPGKFSRNATNKPCQNIAERAIREHINSLHKIL